MFEFNLRKSKRTYQNSTSAYRRTGNARFDRLGGGGGTPDSLILRKLFSFTLTNIGSVVCFVGSFTAVLFAAQFMQSFCRSNESTDVLVTACFCATNCVVKLMICDSRLGREKRACDGDSVDVVVFVTTGNDWGLITLLGLFTLMPFEFT